jgi:Domain of unknown function (DUF4442)
MTKSDFINWGNSPWKMRLFFLTKLPSAWFMGISVKTFNAERSEVLLPYSWWSKNPFKSTYFAAQCAAAELSTGLLCMIALQEQPPISMLVSDVSAKFLKKASDTLTFTCEDGQKVAECVQKAIETKEPQVIRMRSVGRLPDGVIASEVEIVWSFKLRNRL